MRKCRYCKLELPQAKLSDKYQKAGFCDVDHMSTYAYEKAIANREKAARKKLRADKEREREFKKNDLGYQHALTQKSFNKMRRLEEIIWYRERGLEPECISCGGNKKDWCCGHFATVGSSPEWRYSRANTKLQCNFNCNKNRSGNINGNKTTRGYKQGLIDRFGANEGVFIIYCCENSKMSKKWGSEELIEMRKSFNKLTRSLELKLDAYN